eukprot:TRINITY_DN35502_c0_g1_i1.p2 TRINITY_DN35502_c0_g1~~TRINITY_DN35502_c0_g1_i1.p2  ORF type:complete len:304 (-),score=48.24 TRINITY_DN35502_c0_g1_i1:142-1008(-)
MSTVTRRRTRSSVARAEDLDRSPSPPPLRTPRTRRTPTKTSSPLRIFLLPLALIVAGIVLGGYFLKYRTGPTIHELETLTENAQAAVANLRVPHYQWYIVPLLAFDVYIYSTLVSARDWSRILAGLALFGTDWFNEIWNGLVLYLTGKHTCWLEPSNSVFLVFVGLNVETQLMFLIAGIAFCNFLDAFDKNEKWMGISNRWFLAAIMSAFCVFVEVLLNACDALSWDLPWWNRTCVLPIFLAGYYHFYVLCFWVYDMEKLVDKIRVVINIFALDIFATLVFGVGLQWL